MLRLQNKMNSFLIVFTFCSISSGLFFLQRYIQLCVNSDRPNIQSMCLLCDSKQFRTMSYICTGQYTVPANTTQEQAFCLISTCLRQVPGQQGGTAVGRKRRELIESNEPIKTYEISIENNDEDDDNSY
ncbi:uncharacterized protein LOC128392541 [Panonychus citri]|uniref:uncharacterized protein LOC128392541 n=1 Tax=Panonychus citri TaxID=50023 RepID=UPI0023082684|nr:uncharacterized protein LOC128392541 [Panonychus citri]